MEDFSVQHPLMSSKPPQHGMAGRSLCLVALGDFSMSDMFFGIAMDMNSSLSSRVPLREE